MPIFLVLWIKFSNAVTPSLFILVKKSTYLAIDA
jgi:hypothetical protein